MAEPGAISALHDSGLDHRETGLPGLRLVEVTGLRLTSLRLHPVAAAAPPHWPGCVGEVVGEDPALCCLRPGEWLEIATPSMPSREVPTGAWIIDHSHGLAVLRVSGPCAPWLLAQLCALDFQAMARASAPRCDQARMGHVRVVVLTRPVAGVAEVAFDLLVDRSLARYLWERMSATVPHALRLVAQVTGPASPAAADGA